MAAAARWSDVPQDILFFILRRLILVDYVRFGAVCSSWHSAAPERRCPPAAQPPWLMFPGSNADRSTANFLSLSSDGRHNKVYTIRLPFADLRDRKIVGSSDGWLITVDRRCVASMLNPITGAEITLPPVTTFPNVKAHLDPSGAVTGFTFTLYQGKSLFYAPEELSAFYFTKIIVVPGPLGIGAGDYTAVAITQGLPISSAFARGGEKKWTLLRPLHLESLTDIIYHNGLFYGVASTGNLVAFDLCGPRPQVKMITANFSEKAARSPQYYVVESSGDLLVVSRFREILEEGEPHALAVGYAKPKVTTYRVRVLKLNDDNHCEEVKNLADQALFLGLSYSTSLSVLEFPDLKENCIYFTDDDDDIFFDHAQVKRDVGVYRLESGTMDIGILEPYRYELNWPLPLWMTPHM